MEDQEPICFQIPLADLGLAPEWLAKMAIRYAPLEVRNGRIFVGGRRLTVALREQFADEIVKRTTLGTDRVGNGR